MSSKADMAGWRGAEQIVLERARPVPMEPGEWIPAGPMPGGGGNGGVRKMVVKVKTTPVGTAATFIANQVGADGNVTGADLTVHVNAIDKVAGVWTTTRTAALATKMPWIVAGKFVDIEWRVAVKFGTETEIAGGWWLAAMPYTICLS